MARLLPVALLMAALAASGGGSAGSSAPPSSPAVLVNQIIGQNALAPTVATADVAGCDLGICFVHQGDDLWMLFGDTFGNGSDFAKDGGARTAWRSQTLARAAVRAAAAPAAEATRGGAPARAALGLTLAAAAWDEVSATDPTARQLMHAGHQTDLRDELTVIPTAGWSNGSHAHVWYMSVRHFDGDTWTCNNASIGTAEHLAASAFTKHSDSVLWAGNAATLQFAVANYDPAASPAPTGVSSRYVYLLGTPCGRLGAARLLRVATDAALHSDQYEYFSGTVGGADTWSSDAAAAVAVIPAGVGELSVTWVPALQRWLALYSAAGYHPSGKACGIVARVSPALAGGWSEPRLVMSNDYTPAVGVVYGGYTHPRLLSGDEVYFTASFHTSYNVHLAKFNLSTLFPAAHDHQERIQSPSVLPIVSPLATLFSSKGPSHGAPASIENYGNTLSLLLLPPQLGDNSTILIAATRGNVNKVSNVPVLRRSSDGGVSFGTVILPVGVPAPGVSWQQVTQAYDAVANRLIIVLGNATTGLQQGNLTCESGVLHQTVSTDRGLTFSPVQDISHSLPNLHDRSCISPSGGVGIQLRPGTNHAGRMLIAATHHAYQGDIILRQDSNAESAVYNATDDLHHPGLDEMQLVQLSNGSIMALARNCADATGSMKNCMMMHNDAENSAVSNFDHDDDDGGGGGGKRVMVSVSESGVHWSTPRPHKDLVTPVCNFGVTHYRGAVLFSGPYNETTRTNLSVLASTDGNGVSFDRSLVLHAGAAGYSSIQCGLPATYDCAVLFSTQSTREIQLVRFQSQALLKADDEQATATGAGGDGSWSWRRTPTMCQVGLSGRFVRTNMTGDGRLDERVVRFLAHNYDVIVANNLVPGRSGCLEPKLKDFADRIAAIDNSTRVLAYKANQIHHGAMMPPGQTPDVNLLCGLDNFKAEWIVKTPNGSNVTIHAGKQYAQDLSNPQARAWWLGVITNRTLGENVHGVFADNGLSSATFYASQGVTPARGEELLQGQQQVSPSRALALQLEATYPIKR